MIGEQITASTGSHKYEWGAMKEGKIRWGPWEWETSRTDMEMMGGAPLHS